MAVIFLIHLISILGVVGIFLIPIPTRTVGIEIISILGRVGASILIAGISAHMGGAISALSADKGKMEIFKLLALSGQLIVGTTADGSIGVYPGDPEDMSGDIG